MGVEVFVFSRQVVIGARLPVRWCRRERIRGTDRRATRHIRPFIHSSLQAGTTSINLSIQFSAIVVVEENDDCLLSFNMMYCWGRLSCKWVAFVDFCSIFLLHQVLSVHRNSLPGDDWRVYELIVRHFLACISRDAKGHETKATVSSLI